MQRVLLFLATNLAVVLSLSVVGHVLGVNRFLDARGLDFGALLGFAALFGFGGAFLSLAIAKWSAKMVVGSRVITEPADAREVWLVETVAHHARNVGISMPEVAIYAAEEINAFATGMRRDSALVAVSSGLLHRMSGEEADAVVAHEISHIANDDMVTLAQGNRT